MRARYWLYLYLALLPLPTFVHSPALLALALLCVIALAGQPRWQLLGRSVLAVLLFNLTLSLAYILIGLWRGDLNSDWLLLTNLRVLLMVYLGFCFIHHLRLVDALDGWPDAQWLLSLLLAQIRVFERLLSDCRLAFASRNITRPSWLSRSRSSAAQITALLDKTQARTTETSLAMRSRGAFDA